MSKAPQREPGRLVELWCDGRSAPAAPAQQREAAEAEEAQSGRLGDGHLRLGAGEQGDVVAVVGPVRDEQVDAVEEAYTLRPHNRLTDEQKEQDIRETR